MTEVCWRIFYGDLFLGYEYAVTEFDALAKAVAIGGVASRYGQPKEKLKAEKA